MPNEKITISVTPRRLTEGARAPKVEVTGNVPTTPQPMSGGTPSPSPTLNADSKR
jgi:hypothetical protein